MINKKKLFLLLCALQHMEKGEVERYIHKKDTEFLFQGKNPEFFSFVFRQNLSRNILLRVTTT